MQNHNKELDWVQNDMIAACRQVEVEQVHIKTLKASVGTVYLFDTH